MSRCNPTAWQNFWWNVCDWFRWHGMKFAIVLAIVLAFYISEAHAERVAPEYENTNVLIKVNWFDTTKELQEALTARGEEDFYDTAAYSECEVFYEDGDDIGFCELWVVRPRVVDKSHTKDLGHEVLHGLMGAYHKE